MKYHALIWIITPEIELDVLKRKYFYKLLSHIRIFKPNLNNIKGVMNC